MVAIIPAAGKGTRMAEVTRGRPKELLRIGSRTVLAAVFEEAVDAGAQEVVVVSSIEKPTLTEAAHALGARVVLQPQPLGLADAVAICNVSDETLILFGDCVFHGGSPLPRMADLVSRGIEGCIAVETASDEETKKFGIVEVDDRTGGLKRMLEKPGPLATESRFAVAARMAFGPRFMAYLPGWLARRPPGGAEIPLTPVIADAVAAGFDFKAVMVQPGDRRVDCGEPDSYREALWLDWD